MSKISTYTHGAIDYLVALVLFFAPTIFAFEGVGNWAEAIPRALGVIVLVQALITDYELSLVRMLPMPAHIGIDLILGLFLAVSPWLFGFNVFSENVWVPHLLAGIAIIAVALVSERVPRYRRVRRPAATKTSTAEVEEQRRANL